MKTLGRFSFLERKHFLFWAFLSAYLVFSLLTFKDYGITWDEPEHYGYGQDYLHHYFEPWNDDDLLTREGATHNYIYPALLRVACPSLDYKVLHLLNLLFGSLTFGAVYLPLLAVYESPLGAVAGCLFLFLTPRFLGDLPANPKDAPFAILYFLSLAGFYLIPRKVEGRGLQSFWIGTLIGITTCVRVLGLTLLPTLAIYDFYGYFSGKKKPDFWPWFSKELVQWARITLFALFWMLNLWPYCLESRFPGGFLDILRTSRDFYWDREILFMGHLIHPASRLWYYLPVWIAVTTPLFVLAFFLFSLFFFWKRKPGKSSPLYFLLMTALGLNLFLYFVLKPIIYNGLRHYLFLLPILSTLAAMGFIEFVRHPFAPTLKKTGFVLTFAGIFCVVVQLARIYPYSYVYFNEAVGGLSGAYGKFETDYWATSLKECAQWTAAHEATDPQRTYKVQTATAIRDLQTYYFKPNMEGEPDEKDPDYSFQLNDAGAFTLPPELKSKVVFTVQREAVPFAYVVKMK